MKKSHRKSNHTHHTNHKRANYNMTKKLIIAIISIFVLIIILGAIVFLSDVKEPEQSEAVTALVTTCDAWCEAEAINNWCDFELSAGENSARGSCYGFANSPFYTEFGVNNCPAIDCNNRPEEDLTCSGLGGIWEAPTTEGQCEQIGDTPRLIEEDAIDNPPVEGQICCTAPIFSE